MPQQSRLVQKFAALADPTRLSIVEVLAAGPKTVSELAEPAGMRLTSFMQHLRLLEATGIVTTSKIGRVRTCKLVPTGLDEVEGWIDQRRADWNAKLDRLEDYLRAVPKTPEGTSE
jgi:DNA-binding transcriptional ArsR family regulator